MSIQKLPSEVLVLLFNKLNSKDVESCQLTCLKWKYCVALYILKPNLQHLAKNDAKLFSLLHAQGWNDEIADVDLIIALHEKLKSIERWLIPAKTVGPSKIYFPYPNTKELSHSAIYNDKVYLSFSNGSVQSRSLEDDFSLLHELHEATSLTPSVNSFVAIDVYGDILVVVFQPISDLLPVHLWNAQSDERLFFNDIQVPSSVAFIKDVCINKSHIVMTTNSHIIVLKLSVNPIQIIEHKFIDQPSLPAMELERFYLDVNEQYLIVMTGLVTPYSNRPHDADGLKRKSLLQCRPFNNIQRVVWPSAEKIENLEIESIKVSSSKYNVLAMMYLDSQQSQFHYLIQLMEIPSGNILQNVLDSSDSDLRMPLKWLDNQLFMKVTPKKAFSSVPYCEDEDLMETLSILNIETHEERFTSKVNLRSYGRHILIDFARIVEISIYVPDAQNGIPYDRHQLSGQLYEFWNT